MKVHRKNASGSAAAVDPRPVQPDGSPLTGPQLRLLPALLLILAGALLFGAGSAAEESPPDLRLVLEPYAAGLLLPTDVAFDPGAGALHVTEIAGVIRRVTGGLTLPFLDIRDRVSDEGDSHGLLGLAFHPRYAENGFLYVYYTDSNLDTQVSRFTANAERTAADPASERMILHVAQPTNLHQAGDLFFGPDGYLYIPLGDGGPQNDPSNNAQNPATLLGKVSRIDVDGGDPYAVPPDNPFVDDPAYRGEIWALGLRNPWRGSFDRETGDLYLGDVGWKTREEINRQPAGVGGLNYGWSCYEGLIPNPETLVADCGAPEEYARPIAEYAHRRDDCSVTGGYVYRGTRYPEMVGRYFFTDFCSGNFGDLRWDGSAWQMSRHRYLDGLGLVSFGEDPAGELFVANIITGELFHLGLETEEEEPDYRLLLPVLLSG